MESRHSSSTVLAMFLGKSLSSILSVSELQSKVSKTLILIIQQYMFHYSEPRQKENISSGNFYLKV